MAYKKRAACEACKEGTNTCHGCDRRGCEKCVQYVCSDCGVDMCRECRDSSHIQCGCYGTCDVCGTDVDRGEHGWPCYECDKWYCHDCRYKDNACVECNPPEDEEEKDQEDAEADAKTKDE